MTVSCTHLTTTLHVLVYEYKFIVLLALRLTILWEVAFMVWLFDLYVFEKVLTVWWIADWTSLLSSGQANPTLFKGLDLNIPLKDLK